MHNEEDFKKTSIGMIEMAQKIFDADKEHAHMIFLAPKDRPEMMALLFDQIAKEVAKETKPGEPFSFADRDRAFSAIADVAYKLRAIGYFEIAEGWGLAHSVEPDDPNAVEKVMDQYRKAIKEHQFIQNMPIKEEILTVRGRFLGTMMMHAWKIRRQNEAVWLEPMSKKGAENSFMPYKKDDISRAGMIDQAIDKVIEEEKAGAPA